MYSIGEGTVRTCAHIEHDQPHHTSPQCVQLSRTPHERSHGPKQHPQSTPVPSASASSIANCCAAALAASSSFLRCWKPHVQDLTSQSQVYLHAHTPHQHVLRLPQARLHAPAQRMELHRFERDSSSAFEMCALHGTHARFSFLALFARSTQDTHALSTSGETWPCNGT